eukprot:2579592-Rhodomonas_salina.2
MAEGTDSEVEKELNFLKESWGTKLKVLGVQYEGDVGSAACFTLKMPLSSPDFQHDIGGFLKMTITLPVGYPLTKPCEVVVTNDSIDKQVRVALGTAIAAEANGCVGKLMVQDVLKFVDSNLVKLFDGALESSGGAANKRASQAPATSTPAAPAAAVDGGESAVWSVEQQKCLEAALKEFPASIEAGERWKLISSKVPEKSKKECVARFKELKSKLTQSAQSTQQNTATSNTAAAPASSSVAEFETNEAGTMRAVGAARNSMVPLPDAPYDAQQEKGAERHHMCSFLADAAPAAHHKKKKK